MIRGEFATALITRAREGTPLTANHLLEADVLRLGDAPRPSTDRELERRVHDAVLTAFTAEPGSHVRGVEHMRVQSHVRGSDVTACHVDISGVELTFPSDAPTSNPDEAGLDDVTVAVRDRETGMLREGSISGAPVLLQGVAVNFEVRAANVPIDWLTLADGGLGLSVPKELTRKSRRAVRLRCRVQTNPEEFLRVFMDAVRTEFSEVRGLHADREKLTLKQLGPRRVRIDLRVRLRWKFLRPSFRVRTEVHIDNRFVARLRRTRITSSNLLLSAALRVLRGRINRELRTPVDLNEALAPFSLSRLRITAGSSQVVLEVVAGIA